MSRLIQYVRYETHWKWKSNIMLNETNIESHLYSVWTQNSKEVVQKKLVGTVFRTYCKLKSSTPQNDVLNWVY